MGNLIKNKGKISSSKRSRTSKKVSHKAKVLTVADVTANRSMAYSYLQLR